MAYAAQTAAAFGLRVGVVTSAVPDDQVLHALPVSAQLQLVPAAQTTTFENRYTPAGRQQVIRALAAPLDSSSIPPAWTAARLVHLAPVAGEVDAALLALFPNALKLMTIQGWLRGWDAAGHVHFKHWIDAAALRQADFVVCSEEDFATQPDLETIYAQAAARLIVTRAARGGSCYVNGLRTEFSAPAVQQLHPTGAGDVFAAALFCAYWLLRGDLRGALSVAAHLAALSVTRAGLASAPTPQEARQALLALGRGDDDEHHDAWGG